MAIIVPDPPRSDIETDVSEELQLNRDMTEYFIDVNPYDVVLIPHVPVKQQSGGTKMVAQEPRVMQRMRLIIQSDSTRPTRLVNGQERSIDFMLLGQFDAAMAPFDRWRDSEGQLYEIVELAPFNGYEMRGLVTKHGHG